MFDDVFAMMMHCAESFQDGVRDSFGTSMIADVLDPIRKEIDSLRIASTDFQRQTLSIDHILQDARMIQCRNDEDEQ